MTLTTALPKPRNPVKNDVSVLGNMSKLRAHSAPLTTMRWREETAEGQEGLENGGWMQQPFIASLPVSVPSSWGGELARN
jgi:hypothetical protein